MPTEGDDTITGTGGPDTIDGLGGDDAIRTETGDDSLVGGAGDDSLGGGGGDDTLMGGAGNDVLYGSEGIDIASYADASAAVTVALKRGGGNGKAQGTESAGVDRMWSIEGLIGSDFDDLLRSRGSGELSGGDGDDVLVRGFRAFGGEGFDTAYVLGDVDLRDTSRFSSLELVIGGRHVIGDDAGNRLEGATILDGGGGDDILVSYQHSSTLIGGAGHDKIRGGDGQDTASYADAPAGVVVDLRFAGFQDTGGGGIDRLTAIENLIGSDHNDSLIGDDEVYPDANVIHGGGGRDFVFGNLGSDTLVGGSGNDVLTGGAGLDVMTGDAGKDRFVFLSVFDTATGPRSDVIKDLATEDVIDISAIDADELQAGDQAFVLVAAPTGQPGEAVLEYEPDKNRTILSLYTDDDPGREATIHLRGDQSGYSNFEF